MKSLEASPQAYARLAGAIYLLVILFGGFAEGFVMSTLVAPGDIAATARNISASPDLWRLSVAGDLIVPLIAIVQLWIEYLLLRPVGKNAALLFVLFNAASLAVEAVSKVFLLMVAPALRGAGYATVADPRQLYALAGFALSAHDIAFNVALIPFGCACLVSGYLIFRSGYLPKIIGLLMQLAGASYLVATFSNLFAPALADKITPAILLPALIGESSLCLWLLVRGVNVAKWNEQVGIGARA
jgi:hypothetical protein